MGVKVFFKLGLVLLVVNQAFSRCPLLLKDEDIRGTVLECSRKFFPEFIESITRLCLENSSYKSLETMVADLCSDEPSENVQAIEVCLSQHDSDYEDEFQDLVERNRDLIDNYMRCISKIPYDENSLDHALENIVEDIAGDIPDDTADETANEVSERVAEGISEDMPEDLAEDISNDVPENTVGEVADALPDNFSEELAHDMPGRIDEELYFYLPADLDDVFEEGKPDDVAEDLGDVFEEGKPDDVAEDLDDVFEEGKPDDVAEDLDDVFEEGIPDIGFLDPES